MDNLVAQRLLDSSPKLKEALEIVQEEVYRLTKSEEEARELFTQALGIGINRPVNWSPSSNAAYYKEKYGKILRKWLTELEANPTKDLLLDSKKLRKSRESLVIQISQSFMWLINNAKSQEEADKLVALRASIMVKRVLEGVILVRRREINPEELVSKLVSSQAVKAEKWKEELIKFTEIAKDGQLLHLTDLRLEPYDIAWIKAFIDNSKGLFVKNIGSTSLQIVKHLSLWNKIHGGNEDGHKDIAK